MGVGAVDLLLLLAPAGDILLPTDSKKDKHDRIRGYCHVGNLVLVSDNESQPSVDYLLP